MWMFTLCRGGPAPRPVRNGHPVYVYGRRSRIFLLETRLPFKSMYMFTNCRSANNLFRGIRLTANSALAHASALIEHGSFRRCRYRHRQPSITDETHPFRLALTTMFPATWRHGVPARIDASGAVRSRASVEVSAADEDANNRPTERRRAALGCAVNRRFVGVF